MREYMRRRRKAKRVLINRDCSAIAGRRKPTCASDVQALFCRRRHSWEGHRTPRSGREGQHRRRGREHYWGWLTASTHPAAASALIPAAQPSRLRTISVPAKPRTAIVINITVLAGICVRKSIISLHRYSRADARKRTPQIASMFQRDREKAALRFAHEWGHARHAASKKWWRPEE